jgi:UDPglucose 6-dehydrogenase
MNVGVVGLGVVGGAVAEGLNDLGHDIRKHDLVLNTSIKDVLDSELCFICVPSPSMEDGACNTSIVEEVVDDLVTRDYRGVICIKSTVTPGTTKILQERYSRDDICFVPEFLKERSAKEDFVSNHDLCVIGTDSNEVWQLVKKCHGHYPKIFKRLSPTEAELCKYFNNTFNATLITFANSFYEICKRLSADYTNIKDTMVLRDHINDVYIGCSDDLRGFGGMCLPKDTKAMDHLIKKMGIDVEFFEDILKENGKYEITVYDGMRKQ